jgi:hypothetical protein
MDFALPPLLPNSRSKGPRAPEKARKGRGAGDTVSGLVESFLARLTPHSRKVIQEHLDQGGDAWITWMFS